LSEIKEEAMEKHKEDINATKKNEDKKLTVDFWAEVLQGETPPLFIKINDKTFLNNTRLCLEIFWNLIRIGIQYWENQNGTISHLSEDELKHRLIFLLPIIYKQTNSIKNRTAYFTNHRVNSWIKRDRRLKKTLSIIEQYIYERDKEGNILELALRKPGLSNPHNLVDSTDNPQREMIVNKEESIVNGVLDKLEFCGKHGSVQRKIMDMLLDEITIGQNEAETLGVETDQVANLTFQTRRKTLKIADEEDPGLKEKIDLLINRIEKKRKEKKLIGLIILLFVISTDEKMKSLLSFLIFPLLTKGIKKSAKNGNEKINQINSKYEDKKHGPIKIISKDGSTTTMSYEEALKLREKASFKGKMKEALDYPED
jgi:hypothetical protein